MGYDLTYDGNDFEKTECIFQTVPTVDGGFCQLPFVLNGNLKTSCILHGNSYKCAVPGKENNKGEYEDYTMKTCLRKYPRIRTLHRNHSLGKVCHFPFIHENEEYTDRCAPMFRDAVGTRIYPNGMPCKRLRTDVSYEGEKFDVWPTWCYTDKAMKTWGECKDKTLKFEDIWCSYCENGLCVEKDNKVTCLCYGGWVGRYCEDVDRCFSDKESKDEYDGYCSNKGICDPAMLDEARCTCKIGYSGDTCEKFDPCSLNLCNIDNTKKCTRNKNDFICVCKPGFTSKLCLVNKACFNNPCENGGTCSTYRDIVSSTPATGTTDTPIIDYLDADSQQIEFEKCTCTKDYVGFFCEEVVACPSDKSKGKCKNGAICLSDDYGNPKCNCTFGYRGIFCEKVNLCNPSNCKNDGICKLVADSYECLCPDSFEGVNCEIPTDKCYQVTCKNFGVCNWDASRKVGFKCECTPGFYGEFCNDRKSICQHEPCLNGGACRDLDIRRKLGNEFVFFVCKCFKRHNGVYCEVPPEEKTIIRHTDTAWKSFVKSMYIAGQVAIPIYMLAYVYLVVKERDNRRYAAARSRSLNIPKVARPSTNICVVLVHVIAVMFCCETVYRSEHMDPPQHHPTPEEQDYKKTKLEIQQKKKKKNRGKVEGFVTQEQRIKEYDEGVLEDKRLMRQIRAKHRSKTRNEQISKEKKESEAWIQNQQNKNKSKNNQDNYNMNQFTDESLSLIKYEIV